MASPVPSPSIEWHGETYGRVSGREQTHEGQGEQTCTPGTAASERSVAAFAFSSYVLAPMGINQSHRTGRQARPRGHPAVGVCNNVAVRLSARTPCFRLLRAREAKRQCGRNVRYSLQSARASGTRLLQLVIWHAPAGCSPCADLVQFPVVYATGRRTKMHPYCKTK